MDTIRDDALVRIEVDIEHSLVISTWKDYIPSPEYRLALWQVLDQVRAYGLRLWLSDTRDMGIILHSDERWSMATFVPELMKFGLRRVGVVRGEDYFNRTTTERLVGATAAIAPFQVELFRNPEDAQVWLKKELEALV